MRTSFTRTLKSIRLLMLLCFMLAFGAAQAQYKYNYAGEIGAKQQGVVQLSGPRDVAVDKDGNIYVANHTNNSIMKFGPAGNLLVAFGGTGSTLGKFIDVYGVAVDKDGFVYVADGSNDRIQKFDGQGNFVLTFGGTGTGTGQLRQPAGIAIDQNGFVYVADSFNNRVQKFDSQGGFLQSIQGTSGNDNYINSPKDVAVDAAGNIYVIGGGFNTPWNHVKKFDSAGNFVAKIGEGDITIPQSLFAAADGTLFVGDGRWSNFRIQKFGADGSFTKSISSAEFGVLDGIALDASANLYATNSGKSQVVKLNQDAVVSLTIGGERTGEGQFMSPKGIATDATDAIYVTENSRVQKFNKQGQLLMQFGAPGAGNGQLSSPNGIAVDNAGNIYVLDSHNHRVQKFDSRGVLIKAWGSSGSAVGQFNIPKGIAVDASGNVYVADTQNHRIQQFDSDGNFINSFGEFGTTDGKLYNPSGLVFDNDGNLLVLSFYFVQKFTAAGEFIKTFATGNTLSGIARDADGNIYVTKGSNFTTRVEKLSPDGVVLTTFGGLGIGQGEFEDPEGIAVTSDGSVFVADKSNNRVQYFTRVGIPILEIKYGSTLVGNYVYHNFGEAALPSGSKERVYTVTNKGAEPLELTEVTITGNHPNDYTVDQSETVTPLAPGASTTFKVVFKPTYAYSRTATLTLTSNDTDKSPVVLYLSGTGVRSDAVVENFENITKTFGDAPFDLAATSNSTGAISYTIMSSTGAISLSGEGNKRVTIYGAGTATIRAMVDYDDNYYSTFKDITVTVNKATQTITLQSPGNKVYGDASISLPVTSSANLSINYTVEGPAVVTGIGSNPKLNLTGVGTVRLIATQVGNTNYQPATPVEHTFTVAKKELVVKADDKSRVYGQANPLFTLTYTGFVSGESASVLTAAPLAATAATATSDIGTYPITVSGGQAANYSFTFQPGTLTISKAVAAVTISNLEQTYNGQPKQVTVTTSPQNLAVNVTYGGSATAPSAIGTYSVVATVTDNNYSGTQTATLRINKVSQTITLQSPGNKTYGDSPISLPANSSANLPIAYTLQGPATLTGTAANPQLTITGAGTVTLTATQAGNDTYLAAIPVEHTFTVAKKVLVVKAEDKERVYGEAYPQLSITYQGFVAGENSSQLQTLPVASTVATSSSDVGTYPITVSGGQAANYSFTYQSGTLTIVKAPAALTIVDLEQTYDGQPKEVTVFKLPNSIAVRITYNGSETPPTAAGSYNVAVIVTDKNYYGEIYGTLRINKLNQSIALQAPGNKTYGDAAVNLPATSSANLIINYAVTGPAEITGTAANPQLSITGAGTVRLTATQAGNEQYEAASPVEHTFTVAKKELTVRAENKSRVYGQPNPQLTYTFDGFVNGESVSVLAAAPVAATTATVTSNAGTYPITLSGGQAANYSFAYQAAVLTITKAEASLTVSDLEQQYDGQAKQVTVVTAPQELAVRVTYNGSETLPVAAGTYNVVVTVVDDNYDGSATATLNILNSTAIADVKETQATATLYPNPTADGRVVIDGLKKSQKVQLTVTDATGRKVWQTQTSSDSNGAIQLDLGNKVSTGLYFIQISEGQGKATVLKLVKK